MRAQRRGWRRLKRVVLVLAIVLAGAVGAALIAVHTDWGRGLVRAQIEHQLQGTFTGGATVGRVEGSPLSRLTLRDVVINGPDRRPAITAKTLMVDVGILPLLSHQARVLALHAEDVDIDLRRDASGELEVKQLTRPGPRSVWSVQLPKVELRRAHLRVDTGGEVMNFDDVTLDGRATLPHDGPIDASVELTATWRERRAAPLSLQTVVHSGDDGVMVPALALKAGTVSATANLLAVRKTPDGPAISGSVIVDATAAEVERLVPSLRLPADVAVTITAHPVAGQPWTELAIAGRVDRTPVHFVGAADLAARHARGQLATGALDLGKLSAGRVTGTAAATVAFDARPGGPRALPVASATIRGWGAVDGVPRTSFDVTLHSAGERMRATVEASGDRLRARLAASLRMVGEALSIEDGELHATADPARASGGKAPVHGALRIDLVARGAVRPQPSLAVTGRIDGDHLRMEDLSVAALHVAVDAQRLPNRPLGTAHVQLVDLVRQDAQLGELTVDATDRADGKVAVAVRSRPKQNPWLIDADAVVTPPGEAGPRRVVVDVVRHRVRVGATAASGTDWTGRGGRVEFGPERIAVRDLASASRVGRVAIAGSYERAGGRRGDLAASIDATGLSLDSLASRYHGKVDAHVAVTRRRNAWEGEVAVDGKGISIDPKDVVVDGHIQAGLHGRRVALTANASSLALGSATVTADLDTPANVGDAAAWKRLGRSAIRTGELTLRGVDVRRAVELAGLADAAAYGGRIDGDIRVASDTTGGRVELTGLVAPQLGGLGAVGAVLDLSQTAPTEIVPTLTVSVEDLGRASLQAHLQMPDRVFDPAAWQRLGRGALRGATLRAENIAIDPAQLDRLGITSQMRGRVSVAVDLGEAARSASAAIDIAELRGAPIVQPIELHLEAASDERATRSSLAVSTKGTPLLQLEGVAPVALAQLLARRDRDAMMATPLDASAKLARVDVPRLLAVFGRSEIIAGAVDGSIDVAGTLGAPTVTADLRATGLRVPPGPRGKPERVVERLSLTGSWDGERAKLAIDGVESAGGTLQVAGEARPRALRDGTLTVKATKFDLLPILAFLPGPAGGAAGQLDADLTLTGLDLRTTKVAGEMHLSDARVPIAPDVGTLRRAKIDAVIADRQIQLLVDGRLGAGSVAVTGSVALDGAAPNGGNAKITLRKISPIGVIEPQISADITAALSHNNDQWRADLVVDNGSITIPKDRGEKLKPAGAPPDMRFASGARITRRPKEQVPPSNPILVATIALRSTRVESDEFRGLIKGKVELRLDGDAIGLTGGIEADRGDLDLFGHRYYVERANVYFDGPLDPLLDVRISHEFADVTTVTEVHGRASAPELTMSSDPGLYSQDQLLGFLLGGEPSGDPQAGAASDKVTSAGESYLANKLGGYVRDALPVDVDVLRYEAATSSSSAAVIVGTWVTHTLFLAYRQHLGSRTDENTGEGEVEWWLSRRVMVEGTAGDKGYNGVDLLWRMRY